MLGDGFADEIRDLKTQFDVFRFMKRMTGDFGMRSFLVATMPHDTSRELSSCTIITSWPSELLSQYDQHGFLTTSPVVQRMRTSVVPFIYDVSAHAEGNRDQRSEDAAAMFERFGLPVGLWMGVHETSGARGLVSFSGDRRETRLQDIAYMHLLACHVYDRLAEIRLLDNRVADSLTEREVECLNWTSAGKTSAEISEILKLSEHTVNHYLNRATRKLDAVNRTQAVAKAIRIGLIR